MTLIDALYINMGGGKVLLDYLCRRLIERNVEFLLLKDERCGRLQCEDDIRHLVVMRAGLKERKAFYKQHRSDYTSVLCFGNVPPPVKMPCKVHTYFHNINLLNIPEEFPLKRKAKNWMKRQYIASKAGNTDSWIVQTQNTEDSLRQTLPCRGKQVIQMPFYDIPKEMKTQARKLDGREGYILVGDHTGTRGHDELLSAFRVLKEQGIMPTLHLTVSDDSTFPKDIEKAQNEGLHIVNHGIIPFRQLADIYGQCKATVYPSVNESLGLGIIEAIEAGCDVIASDLPFVHTICQPSEVFFPRTAEAIANAITRYEQGQSPKSRLLIHDCVDELINLINA